MQFFVNKIINIYTMVFAKPIFYKWHKLLYRISLHGMGLLNYENDKLSGENNFINTLSLALHNNDAVIDVGANNGTYSLKLLKIHNTQCFAFEPHPKTYKELLKNLNDTNVCCFNMGLGDNVGESKLYDYADLDGSQHASIYKAVIEDIHGKSAICHEVKMTTIDHFVAEYKINSIGLLKIDTEGNELSVLKGAANTLSKGLIKNIHFEFNEMNIISRSFLKDFYDLLEQYDFYRLLPNGMIRLEYKPIEVEIFAYQNIVAKLKVMH